MNQFENFNSQAGLREILDIEAVAEQIDQNRIHMESFRGEKCFEDAEIDRDLERCRELKRKFDEKKLTMSEDGREQMERGIAAEFTFHQALSDYGWLSKDLTMITASQYDDYVRGIDSIVQINTGPEKYEHIGLGIDFGTSIHDVGYKLRKTFDEIDMGFPASVKYFETEKTGKLKNFKLPRLVVGAGHQTLERLASYSAEIMSGSDISESMKEDISNDPFRYVLFGEIEAQLTVFIDRLTKVVDQADQQGHEDIKSRALATLSVYERCLEVTQELAAASDIDTKTMQRHLKGDHYAMKMYSDLIALSKTPIDFERKNVPKET